MSEPFLAEIRMMGFNFAPRGWGMCDGQILPINQNQSLYSLLGTTYGGDGRTSFGLPDLRSRTPIHRGAPSSGGGFAPVLGTKTGEETHTLSGAEMPQHTHTLSGSTGSTGQDSPTGHLFASGPLHYHARSGGAAVPMSSAVGNTGGGQAHDNMQPYTTLNFCIALRGLFPSRN